MASPKKSLEEISNDDFPPLDIVWMKEYLDGKDPYHLKNILVRLDDENFEKLSNCIKQVNKLKTQTITEEITSELEEIEAKLKDYS